MSVLQMQRISICAMKKDRKAILEELQRLGVMEIETSRMPSEGLEKMDTLEDRQKFEKQASILDQALDVLQEYAPEKTSMLSSLEGKKLVERKVYQDVVSNRESILDTAQHILLMKKKEAEGKAEIVKLLAQKEALLPWLSLSVPMDYEGTKKTKVFIGSIGSVMTQEEVMAKIAEAAPDLTACDVEIVSADKDQTCLTAICLRTEADLLEEALRSAGFSRPAQTITEIPAKEVEKIETRISEVGKEIADFGKEIQDQAGHRENLKTLSDYYRTRAQRYEVLGQVPQTRNTFVISGYIAKKNAAKLAEKLDREYSLSVEIEDLPEEEEAPVLLENGKATRSVEGVLESFGLPAKGEVDPTKIMFVFYVFLFGLMLSDAAYGLIIFVACAVLLKKYPRMSDGMAKSLRMFMYCGISTLVWGILFGGYFGDVVNVVSRVFFGHEVGIPALWFVPLNDPMKLLIFSMLFGLIHLFTGLAIKGYMCLRDKRYMDFFCDVVLWFAFLIGLILMLLPSSLFYSISQMHIVFPAALETFSKVLAIVGAVGLLLMSGRSSKNPALRIALGAYDLYNITGWLSDVLSYSRLLALGLATGVIASVVNQMGSMAGKGVFGAIVFIIVFIIGHIFNIAINLLGAYVHTNRLQYVEFFGKFYEGGGRAFNPFKANTKYVDVKEETK
ncbi:V-type ATP synthase subunit I [Sellimonas caecigallum]|uniref:V-type ATP synthase subunit I n=1 Tax=Sellimonas caecigallum TaxID=2592333 RepID=A0ABS7L596_9FIRM|nr:V-type ATP synthase subunit I [Sellimonas caecigallum]MBY0758118.1 V-type ATP synthase subunit I [Sellimonas caecigallum]OUP02618.1 V-type ATP synthase subunit I [Drancourtella sp. An210]